MHLKKILILLLLIIFQFESSTSVSDYQYEGVLLQETIYVNSKELPFKNGEKLSYVLHYGLLNAGIAELSVKESKRKFKNSRKSINMIGKGWTTGATDWFFEVNDHYETYMDLDSLESLRFIRRVNEGGFIINQDYYFDQDSNKVRTQDNAQYDIPEGAQDMLSSFYYARTIDFSKANYNDIFVIPAFVDNQIEYLRVKYKGKETIKIRNGKYRCLKFNPLVLEGRVFKDDDDVTVWISDDKNKIPVLIKSKIIVGSIKAELSDYSGIAHPISRVN